MSSSTTEPCQSPNTRMVQNFYLVWLDENINEADDKWRNSITSLREVVNAVYTFTDADRCLDFITDMQETAFMILSAKFSEILIPILLHIVQINRIYILCENKLSHEKWLKGRSKVSGIKTDIISVCEALKKAAHDYDHNAFSISFIKQGESIANRNLDTLNCSFMYTQMLKNILLTLKFNDGHFREFISYCCEQYVGNPAELRKIDKIKTEYDGQQAIRWYTYGSFLYSMVNRALRTMEVGLIVTMGFFIRDLHNHITALHQQQYGRKNNPETFIVYRGQGLSQTDFDQLKTSEGGLLAFNNFLSTSFNREVSLLFTPCGTYQSDLVGVLFVITIDSRICTTPVAHVKDVSYHKGEEEVLFAMHSVFRIGKVELLQEEDRIWQVNLTLTSNNDPQLANLMKHMEDQTAGTDGWSRLGGLMIQLGQFNKALDFYNILLRQPISPRDTGFIYASLGVIKNDQGQHVQALSYYDKALEILQKALPPNHPSLATSYNNIAGVYDNMGEYSKALSYYDKALEIRQKALPPNHPDLASSYNNIGLVYDNMGEYSKALSYYDKALEILQKALPPNHPDLATSYNNIAGVYYNMGEYSKALSYYDKALEIRQKALPTNHPDLATSYNNIAGVYYNMGEYSKALSYYDKALEIRQKALPPNHPDLASSYNNIAGVYDNMGEYSKALSYYDKALEIRQKALPPNHPDLATFYNNIAVVYGNMGEYSKALSYYDKALKIRQKALPPNHPDLASSYNNIAVVYDNMGEYSKALSYYDKALEIRQKALPPNHPSLATSYNNIAGVYDNMGEYSKALSYYDKALKIRQKALPPNHPDLASSYNNIAVVYGNMGEYSKALSYCYHALGAVESSLRHNHPLVMQIRKNVQTLSQKL